MALSAMAILILLVLSGCSKRYDDMPAFLPFSIKEGKNHSVGRFKTSYVADQIDGHYRGTSTGPIGVTTFVNIDDLYTTSTFGRMYAEQLMSELSMKGFDVIELRHSDALQFLADGGEFALSRDLAAIRRERDLAGVVVGTYIVSPDRVYVNARLLDPATSVVLSAASVEMSKTKEMARMLRGGSLPGTLERIPVRHLGFSTNPMWGSQERNWRYDAEESDTGRMPSGYSEDFRSRVEPRFEDKPARAERAPAKKLDFMEEPPQHKEPAGAAGAAPTGHGE